MRSQRRMLRRPVPAVTDGGFRMRTSLFAQAGLFETLQPSLQVFSTYPIRQHVSNLGLLSPDPERCEPRTVNLARGVVRYGSVVLYPVEEEVHEFPCRQPDLPLAGAIVPD